MIRRLATAVPALALGVIAAAALAGTSAATTPAPAPLADVVFSNGGRILKMNADGTDRKVLFGKDRSPKNDELGAMEPDVSPDGESVVFGFKRSGRFEDFIDVWKVGSDGEGARRLLVSKPGNLYGDPAFAPDGRIVVAYVRTGRKFLRSGLISISRDGGSKRKIFEVRSRRRAYRPTVSVMEPAVSPDGKKVLYLLNEGATGVYFDEGFENTLVVRDLASGRSHRIAGDAYDASWSPDGKKIAYSVQAQSDPEICWWETGCSFLSSVAVIRADGSGRRFLTGRDLDERSPDWSEDGRIVFQSARNLPGVGEAYEIYSIRPDGRCLTMLTNGSPASVNPVWSETPGESSTAPASCGASPPESGSELKLPPRLEGFGGLWLGREGAGRLLTGLLGGGDESVPLYHDCSRESSSRCGPPLGLVNFDICMYRGAIAGALSEGRIVRRQRGIPIFRSDGSELGPFVLLFSGRSGSYFFGGSGKGARLGEDEVDQLRRFDQDAPDGDLAPASFPGFDLRLMEKVKATFGSAGTVARTAKRLGRSPSFVRRNLRASKKLEKFGEYGSVDRPAPNGKS